MHATRPIESALDEMFAAIELGTAQVLEARLVLGRVERLPVPFRAILEDHARLVVDLAERRLGHERDAAAFIDVGCRTRVPVSEIAFRLRPLLHSDGPPHPDLDAEVARLLADPMVGRDVLLAVRSRLKPGPAERLTAAVDRAVVA